LQLARKHYRLFTNSQFPEERSKLERLGVYVAPMYSPR
jgi:hypothetical protein